MKGEKGEMKHSAEEIEKCISTLKNLAKDTAQLANLPEGFPAVSTILSFRVTVYPAVGSAVFR